MRESVDERRGDASLDVGEREPDRLGSEIHADQPRLGGQDRGEVFEVQRGEGHERERYHAAPRVATAKRAVLLRARPR